MSLNDLLGGDDEPRKPKAVQPARPVRPAIAVRPATPKPSVHLTKKLEDTLQRKITEPAPERKKVDDEEIPMDRDGQPHYSIFRRPVGVTFLANVLGKQPKQIQKRLEKCPVEEWSTRGTKKHPMYDFMTAMSYLVPPKGNIEDWFAQQNAASLPPYVNKMWWDSAHQRNRVMLTSNDLWHTEDVLLVLGRVAMTIRQEVKMWIEDLPEKEVLNDAQYGALVDATNRLVEDLRKVLIETPRETLSMTAHIASELESSGKMVSDEDRPEDE